VSRAAPGLPGLATGAGRGSSWRAQITHIAKRLNEQQRPSIRLLASPDPESPSFELIYVGESQDVRRRLKDERVFDRSNDFWSRTAIEPNSVPEAA
jgi:hypothetical protein